MQKFIERHGHFLSIICPILIGAIFIVLCNLKIDNSVWYDEAYTSYLTRGDFSEIAELTALDVHPPLYYFAIKVWSMIFGNGVFALRFFSVFCGLISIIIAFHLIKRHFGVKSAIISAFFMALAPMFIRYSQEMRMYTMVLAIILAATYVLGFALEYQNKEPKRAVKFWFLYALLICAGMWTQYFVVFAWIAHVFYILYYFGFFKGSGIKNILKDKRLVITLVLTYAFAILLFLPWMPTALKQIEFVQDDFWIQPLSFGMYLSYITEGFFFVKIEDLQVWQGIIIAAILIICVILSVIVFKKLKLKERGPCILILLLAFLPPLFLVLCSLPPMRSVFVSRYVLYSFAFFWLYCGLLISLVNPSKVIQKIAVGAILSLLLISTIGGVINVTDREPESRVYNSLQPIAEFTSSGEPILFTSDLNFYDAVAYSTDSMPMLFYAEWRTTYYTAFEPLDKYSYNIIYNIEEFLADHERFWVFANADETEHPEFADYRIVNIIENPYHTVWELEKVAN